MNAQSSLIRIPAPGLQIDFALALRRMREHLLQEALAKAVAAVPLPEIDAELRAHTAPKDLKLLATKGLRGELLFAVPCLLKQNPRLLGYYRLLLGFSQKAFYSREFGTTPLKKMEEEGVLGEAAAALLPTLCNSLNDAGSQLLTGIGTSCLSPAFLDDLTLLTLGAQLRGSANVKRGAAAIRRVFDIIHSIVREDVIASSSTRIDIRNAAGRKVIVEFAPDPDIVIREEISADSARNIIAIEIKGGTDFSNIHNRIGEAEKSHQKARRKGFVECWTIVNVARLDTAVAHHESPSTNRFYRIEPIESGRGDEFNDFRARIVSMTGISGR